MKLLKLMIEDITEANWVGHEAYQVYNMHDFDYVLDMCSKLDVVRNIDEDFNPDASWFINDGRIKSLDAEQFAAFLDDNRETIREIYDELEDENVDLNNALEVRVELLKGVVEEVSEVEEDCDIIYQDIDIEAIADVLLEVSVRDLAQNIGHYGSWQVILVDGTHYLLQL